MAFVDVETAVGGLISRWLVQCPLCSGWFEGESSDLAKQHFDVIDELDCMYL
jgi:hypothetical protein